MSEPTGTYGIIPPPPRPAGRAARAGRAAADLWRRAARPLGVAALLWLAWSMGRDVGRQEGAGRRLALWGVQVEAGAPTTRLVGTGAAVPPDPGPWKQVTLRYWLRRPDGAEPTDADVAASLREWCGAAP